MNKINFLVKGSSADPYNVSFIKEGVNITALCDCPAGSRNTHCKHCINILYGCIDGIISGNEDEASTVAAWLPDSDVEEALDEIRDIEIRIAELKKVLKGYKKKLSRVLSD